MKKIYGSFVIFFYFIKYPMVIYLFFVYLFLDIKHNIIMDILGLISITLIFKDWIYSYKKQLNIKG